MKLTQLYRKGEKLLLQKIIGFSLGGVEDGWTVENNRKVIDSYCLHQCAIDAPSTASTELTFLGMTLKTPVVMSSMTIPIPSIRKGGLMMVAEGIKSAGSMMWTGTPIPENLPELVETGVPIIQNVKPHQDRKKLFKEIEHIQNSNITGIGIEIDAGQGTKVADQQMAKNCAPLSLSELKKIRKIVHKPLVFKGILSAHDASRSLEAGADAIMVSNHGGRTVDYLPHPFQVMKEIVLVISNRIPILMDSGFRRGSDALKGLALGADLVGVGRPILYGLAADGAAGVREVINQITEELRRVMIMVKAGCLNEINADCIMKFTD